MKHKGDYLTDVMEKNSERGLSEGSGAIRRMDRRERLLDVLLMRPAPLSILVEFVCERDTGSRCQIDLSLSGR